MNDDEIDTVARIIQECFRFGYFGSRLIVWNELNDVSKSPYRVAARKVLEHLGSRTVVARLDNIMEQIRLICKILESQV